MFYISYLRGFISYRTNFLILPFLSLKILSILIVYLYWRGTTQIFTSLNLYLFYLYFQKIHLLKTVLWGENFLKLGGATKDTERKTLRLESEPSLGNIVRPCQSQGLRRRSQRTFLWDWFLSSHLYWGGWMWRSKKNCSFFLLHGFQGLNTRLQDCSKFH